MRKIKFRAWDNRNKEMLHDVGYHPTELEARNVDPESGYKSEDRGNYTITPLAKAYNLMQFTGRYYKNGEEMYVGDLVQHYHNEWHKKVIGEVIWYEEAACFAVVVRFKSGASSISRGISSIDVKRYARIGNIHENPTLLVKS